MQEYHPFKEASRWKHLDGQSWEGKRAEVYGKTAEIVNAITVITAIIGSAIYLNKIIKSM